MNTSNYFINTLPKFNLNYIMLRELKDSDAERYFYYMTKPEVMEFLTEENIPKSVYQAEQEIKYWASLFTRKKSFYWAISLIDNDCLIGTIGFNNISVDHKKSEISYDLDYYYWGKGIMGKALEAILTFADTKLGLVRVQANVVVNNQRSINLLEKCKFNREGVLSKFEMINGQLRDYYIYARIF